jgi:hypothetical protein
MLWRERVRNNLQHLIADLIIRLREDTRDPEIAMCEAAEILEKLAALPDEWGNDGSIDKGFCADEIDQIFTELLK